MNYGKKSTQKREKELTSKSTMIRKKFYVIFCKSLLVCVFAVMVIGACSGVGVIRGIIASAPTIDDIVATPTGFLSTVLDANGNQTATLVASGSNRRAVTIDEIPKNLQHAFVAIEDERFYEHNGIDVNPDSIFDVQVKRLHEYKRQLMNILHVMYLYNKIKENPSMDFYPRTFIFGAKAAAGYRNAKKTIKLINSVADVINNDASIGGKLKVVFIEDYKVSNAEIIFAAADVSEQISTASKEASGTGNMKFMLNGALTIGTMDGANVEMFDEVGADNMFIFGMSSDEVISHENRHDYNPVDVYNSDAELRKVVNQLVDGTYSPNDHELFRELYNSLLNPQQGQVADRYFILADFRSYANAQQKINDYYKNKSAWRKSALLNIAHVGKFSSDRTIQEYVDDIWHLDRITVNMAGV